MANENMIPIQTVTVNSSSVASIEFTSIPQIYNDLFVILSVRSNRAGAQNDSLALEVNGSTSNRSGVSLWSDSGGVAGVVTTIEADYAGLNGDTSTANCFSSVSVYCPNYTLANNKVFLIDGVQEQNALSSHTSLNYFTWQQTSAITSLAFKSATTGNLVQYSKATLYGITRYTEQSGGKATGGTVTSDASYWYHTFTTSGMFIPTQNISCDYLIVGGGGGGGGGIGGGGGAGGYRSFTSQSLTSGTNYPVFVGAGGNGWPSGATSNGNGTNGTYSSFNGSVSEGGGYGGGALGSGGNGGSGGGAGGAALTGGTGNSPSTSPAQGTNGGNGANGAGYRGAGGGGGATSAGGTGTGSTAGTGGAGTSSSISGTSVTYAGGGGGGADANNAAGGAGGGGDGQRTSFKAGGAGAANRGAGGGGGGPSGNGGNGGSGIVIIRYAK